MRLPSQAALDVVCVVYDVQGHALLTRQAGSTAPCPHIDFIQGFNQWYAEAYNLDWRNGVLPHSYCALHQPESMPARMVWRGMIAAALTCDTESRPTNLAVLSNAYESIMLLKHT